MGKHSKKREKKFLKALDRWHKAQAVLDAILMDYEAKVAQHFFEIKTEHHYDDTTCRSLASTRVDADLRRKYKEAVRESLHAEFLVRHYR